MLEISKSPITQEQFVAKIQGLCPGKFSETGLKALFHYFEGRTVVGEKEVYLPNICEYFEESTFSECSHGVRELLRVNPSAEISLILKTLQSEKGEFLIKIMDTTVLWFNPFKKECHYCDTPHYYT